MGIRNNATNMVSATGHAKVKEFRVHGTARAPTSAA